MKSPARLGMLASRSLLVAAALAACQGDPPGAGEALGSATARITEVPKEVACIDVRASGAATIERRFDVTAGASSSLALGGLPLGSMTFTAFAYPSACSAVGAGTAPTWQCDPVPASLVAGAPAEVTLVMHRTGGAVVGVDFDPDGGAIGGAIQVSSNELDFSVDCSRAGAGQTLTVTNGSTRTVQVEDQIVGRAASNAFSVDVTTATLAAGQSTSIQVWPAYAQVSAPTTLTDALLIRTDLPGDPPHVVRLVETIAGAALAWAPTGPLHAAPGETVTLTLRNSGNLPASFTPTSSNPAFVVTPSAPQVLLPGGTLVVTVTNATGTSPGDSAFIDLVAAYPDGPAVCGAMPWTQVQN